VFVLLSEIGISGYRDGLPTVVIEAMLMGLPVVSTYVSAIPELVSDGVTGFLVPERNPSEAADVLEHLITNPGLGTAFGMAGRKKVETDFNADTNVNRLLALMTSVNPTARSEPFDSRGLVR
jgi:glycosyltransferase involved in cell wall biosynthesis